MISARYLLALQYLPEVGFPKVGPQTIRQVYQLIKVHAGDQEEERLVDQVLSAYEQVRGMRQFIQLRQRALTKEGFYKALKIADHLLATCSVQGITVLGCDEPAYPQRLLSLPNFPVVVYAKGNLASLNPKHVVAFVGASEVDYNQSQAVNRLAHELAGSKLTMVSALTAGTDMIAQRAWLDAGGQVVVIVAGGVLSQRNEGEFALGEEIVDKGGCWITEQAPEVAPREQHVLDGYRLHMGLTDVVIMLDYSTQEPLKPYFRLAKAQGRKLSFLQPGVPGYHHLEVEGSPWILVKALG